MSDDTFRVPLHELRFKQPVTAGLNMYKLMGFIPFYRDTCEDQAPILVDPPCDCCGVRLVQDGRHRFMASVLAGRVDILAQLDPDGWAPVPAQHRLF